MQSSLTTSAHSVGKVVVERLSENEMENEEERSGGGYEEVHIPFKNENLAVVGKDDQGQETVRNIPFFGLDFRGLICHRF